MIVSFTTQYPDTMAVAMRGLYDAQQECKIPHTHDTITSGYTDGAGPAQQQQTVPVQSTLSRRRSVSCNLRHSPWRSVYSPHDVANMSEWCAQLVCYLWFTDPARLPFLKSNWSDIQRRSNTPDNYKNNRSRRMGHRATASSDHIRELNWGQFAPVSRSQLVPVERFCAFVRSVLRTTQVSHSVVVVALLYIYRLRLRHPRLQGQIGSEYRLFLTSLVLANKFLDDHTYTNKTWSSVSHISLPEISKMELQLWVGIGMSTNVGESEYYAWISFLGQLLHQRHTDLQWLERHEQMCQMSSPVNDARISPRDTSRDALSSPMEVPLEVGNTTPLFGRPEKRKRSHDSNEGHFKRHESHLSDSALFPPMRIQNGDMPVYDVPIGRGVYVPDIGVNTAYTNLLGGMSPFTAYRSSFAPMPQALSYYQLAAGYMHGIPSVRNCDSMRVNSPAVMTPNLMPTPWEPTNAGSFNVPITGKEAFARHATLSPADFQLKLHSPWNVVYEFPNDRHAAHQRLANDYIPQGTPGPQVNLLALSGVPLHDDTTR